jgi:hypothetical protein
MVKSRFIAIAAAAVTAVVAAIQAFALADRSRGEPANDGLRRYVLGEITEDIRVGQQFLVKANGLSSVTIYPRPAGRSSRGTATVEVREAACANANEGTLIARVVKPADDLIRAGALTVSFAPQASWYRTYCVVVWVEQAGYGEGFGLLAARGDGHRDSALIVNGARKWGDLVFETTVTDAVSNFGILSGRFESAGIPAPAAAFGLLLGVQCAALFVLLRSLWERADTK